MLCVTFTLLSLLRGTFDFIFDVSQTGSITLSNMIGSVALSLAIDTKAIDRIFILLLYGDNSTMHS